MLRGAGGRPAPPGVLCFFSATEPSRAAQAVSKIVRNAKRGDPGGRFFITGGAGERLRTMRDIGTAGIACLRHGSATPHALASLTWARPNHYPDQTAIAYRIPGRVEHRGSWHTRGQVSNSDPQQRPAKDAAVATHSSDLGISGDVFFVMKSRDVRARQQTKNNFRNARCRGKK